MVLQRPTWSSRTNNKKYVLFIIGDWNAKVGSQEIPEVTGKFGLGVQNKAGQSLIEFSQENTLIIPTPSSNNTREDNTHEHYQKVKTKIRLIIFMQLKMDRYYTVRQSKLRVNYGSDHEVLIAKFRLKLKKVGKNIWPFRYDPNKIPYNYTVKWSESRSTMSNSLQPHGLHSPWNSPGQNIGVGSLSLLQGIFPAQGSNSGLPHCRRILYQLSHKGSPRILEWVGYPFSGRSSWRRNWMGVSCIAGRFFSNWAIREACTICLT